MKNKFLTIIFSIFLFQPLLAENLNIKSKNISIDKDSRLTVLKDDVVVTDEKKNIFKTNYAEYKKDLQFLKSKGDTTIETSDYFLISQNVVFDGTSKLLSQTNPLYYRFRE